MRSAPIWLWLLIVAEGGNGQVTPAATARPGCGDGVKSGRRDVRREADTGGATCEAAVAPGWVGVLACT